jgi:hypothetical protein
VTVDLETQVRALAERQEVLEKRQALLEQRVGRMSDLLMEIQAEVRSVQRDVRIGFSAVAEQLREVAGALEVVRQRAVAAMVPWPIEGK